MWSCNHSSINVQYKFLKTNGSDMKNQSHSVWSYFQTCNFSSVNCPPFHAYDFFIALAFNTCTHTYKQTYLPTYIPTYMITYMQANMHTLLTWLQIYSFRRICMHGHRQAVIVVRLNSKYIQTTHKSPVWYFKGKKPRLL